MLSRTLAILATLLFSFPAAADYGVALNAQTHIRFASADEGRRVLGSADNFTRALSAFDRSVRRQTEQAVSATDFLEFASQQVLPWSDAEVENLREILAPVGTLFFDRTLRFPPVVLLVKTSGHEEGHTPYHRGNAIVLPAGVLQWPRETLHEIIVHELFHVMTSANPELREALYGVIGFGSCAPLQLPPGLASRKITNPDAPGLGHCMSLGDGSSGDVVFPVLLSSAERYDPARSGGLLEYVALDLVVAEWRDGGWKPKQVDGALTRLGHGQFQSFLDRIGKNTANSAHPEEILADNFVLLVKGVRDVPTPSIIAAIDKVLGWSR